MLWRLYLWNAWTSGWLSTISTLHPSLGIAHTPPWLIRFSHSCRIWRRRNWGVGHIRSSRLYWITDRRHKWRMCTWDGTRVIVLTALIGRCVRPMLHIVLSYWHSPCCWLTTVSGLNIATSHGVRCIATLLAFAWTPDLITERQFRQSSTIQTILLESFATVPCTRANWLYHQTNFRSTIPPEQWEAWFWTIEPPWKRLRREMMFDIWQQNTACNWYGMPRVVRPCNNHIPEAKNLWNLTWKPYLRHTGKNTSPHHFLLKQSWTPIRKTAEKKSQPGRYMATLSPQVMLFLPLWWYSTSKADWGSAHNYA